MGDSRNSVRPSRLAETHRETGGQKALLSHQSLQKKEIAEYAVQRCVFFFSICLKNRWLHLVLRVIIKKDEENPFDEKQWKCPGSVLRTSRFFFSQVKHEQIEAPGSQLRSHSDCLLVKTFRAGTRVVFLVSCGFIFTDISHLIRLGISSPYYFSWTLKDGRRL